ncbi:deoxyribonuclease V [candidate division KSB1 bacterium]|nr:deoxyribonuclease V [candidate division KSB1 bacterium]
MKLISLHQWNVDLSTAKSLQEKLRERIEIRRFDGSIHSIAGADVSYSAATSSNYAAVVVMNYPEMDELESITAAGRVSFPYVPGYLSFREAPILLEVFSKIKTRPDVVLFDGQGIAHPRGMGIASHMGLFLDIPTIGCAKTRLIGTYEPVPVHRGAHVPLWYHDSIIGAVIRSRTGVKPIYISAGHKITLHEALKIIFDTANRYRLPEPVRAAHHLANQLRMKYERK